VIVRVSDSRLHPRPDFGCRTNQFESKNRIVLGRFHGGTEEFLGTPGLVADTETD
jgi:hypothetical protein